MRILHIVFLVVIVVQIFAAEDMVHLSASETPISMEWGISIAAIVDVGIAIWFRKRLLAPAMEILRRDPADAAALGRWRMANMVSMVLAMSINLYGFALRFMGGSYRVVVPFYIASIILMLLWRPRLDDVAAGTDVSPSPLG